MWKPLRFAFLLFAFALAAPLLTAQSNSGTITGTVTDQTGALVPNATVELSNAVSGYTRTSTTDASGSSAFFNLPFNSYRIHVEATGFAHAIQTIPVTSPIGIAATFKLAAANTETVTVEAAPDLVQNDANFHTNVDRSTIDKLPVEGSSELTSIVTLTSPGVAADSNGLLHGLGDHSENSFSVDGQPITDQQSKVFSNQLPASAVQSLEVIDGAPPAEYGDKTSLIIRVTTRSGQGVTKPTGSVALSYGSFGSSEVSGDLAYGGTNWGNFIALSGQQSGRFLDTPEFAVFHDKGNEQNIFDRLDFQLSSLSAMHLNFQYTRSWFQTPNSYDTQSVFVQNGTTPGLTDQRSKIGTVLFQPTYTRILGASALFTFAPYLRRDNYNYYPSKNPLADLGPIQQETVAQQRSLTNVGAHTDVSYNKGRHNAKLGGMYQQTFLRENLQFGLVDPLVNAPCIDATGAPVAGQRPSTCLSSGNVANPNFNPILLPYDRTRGGANYGYHGQTDVKQAALYLQDQITAGNFLLNVGLRGDFYNGLSIQRQAEPRVGLSYSIKPTGTVLRASYARTQETPFNENLVLSSNGCRNPVVQAVFLTLGSCDPAPFNPGFRNEFHAGLQQSFGHHVVISGDYIWKYTHNAYDFSVFGATPVTFPIEWHNAKIPGVAIRANLTDVHGLSAFVTMSSVAARFFNPQIGGVGATVGAPGGFPFRIDHDERFNQTTHLQYNMPFRKSLYYSFNWKYDSGLVAGSTPCYNATNPNSGCANFSFDANGNPLTLNGKPAIDLSSLTPDEQFQAGLSCNGVKASPTQGFTICQASQLTSSLLSIPAPGTGDDDRNPSRIAPRHLFDMRLGDDKLAHWGEHYSLAASLTAINVTNKYALYNFLSTFSGTHYLTPRSLTAELSLHF